ncbi:MAG: hypothetical protein EXS05_13285, partial [Planctomycetaceae bacterium]|nr:hypothetical protein [Planctomycetaceae bacterium]
MRRITRMRRWPARSNLGGDDMAKRKETSNSIENKNTNNLDVAKNGDESMPSANLAPVSADALADLVVEVQAVLTALTMDVDYGSIWTNAGVPIFEDFDVINRLLCDVEGIPPEELADGWGAKWNPNITSRPPSTASERLWLANNNFARFQSALENGISLSAGLAANPLVLDAHVCLKAISLFIHWNSDFLMITGFIEGSGPDRESEELKCLINGMNQLRNALFSPLILAFAKLSIAASGTLPKKEWSIYRSPKQWRIIFMKLNKLSKPKPHSTFKRHMDRSNIEMLTSK